MVQKLFVIEGLDGSGKATQTQLLYENLSHRGLRSRKVSFPDYDSESSALVKMYLCGKFGSAPNDVNAFAASSFYAIDRYASYRRDWITDYNEGIIVADRYTTSNAVHQCSKLPQDQWDSFLDWLYDFEYVKMGIPKPDVVIYLNVAPEVSQGLMSKRYSGDESKKDIHESDMSYLQRSREAAAYCAAKLGWKVIHCCRGEEMRSIQDIQSELLTQITELYE